MLTIMNILGFCVKYKQPQYVFVFASGNQESCKNEFSFSATYKSVLGSTVPNYLSFYNDDSYLCLRNVRKITVEEESPAWAECRIEYEVDGTPVECVIIIKKL